MSKKEDKLGLRAFIESAKRTLRNATESPGFPERHRETCQSMLEGLERDFPAIADELDAIKDQRALRVLLMAIETAGAHSTGYDPSGHVWGSALNAFLGKNIKGGSKGGKTAGTALAAKKDEKWRKRGLAVAKAFVAKNPRAGKRKIAVQVVDNVPDAPGDDAVIKAVEKWRIDGDLPPWGG